MVVSCCPPLSSRCTCTPHTVSDSQTWQAGKAEPLEHSAVSSASQTCPGTHWTGRLHLCCDRSCLPSPPWSGSSFQGGGVGPGQVKCQSRGPERVQMTRTGRAAGRSFWRTYWLWRCESPQWAPEGGSSFETQKTRKKSSFWTSHWGPFYCSLPLRWHRMSVYGRKTRGKPHRRSDGGGGDGGGGWSALCACPCSCPPPLSFLVSQARGFAP